MAARFLSIAILVALLSLTACGGGDEVVETTDTPTVPEDTVGEDIPVNFDVMPGEDTLPDAPGTDTPGTDYKLDTGPTPGGFGWPCEGPNDCDSGYCILTGEKKICTIPCLEECPADFVCAPVTNTPPDVTYLCLPRYDKLCQPCREHQDCQPIWGAGTDLCLDYAHWIRIHEIVTILGTCNTVDRRLW